MPEYLSPGVYVEEIDAGPKPIAAGRDQHGRRRRRDPPRARPRRTLVTSYGDFVRTFGGPLDHPGRDDPARLGSDAAAGGTPPSRSRRSSTRAARAMYFQRVEPGGGRRVQPAASTAGCSPALDERRRPDDHERSRSAHVFGIAAGDDPRPGQREDGSVLGHGHRRRASTTATRDGHARPPPPASSARRGRDLAVDHRPVDTALRRAHGRRRQRRRLGRRR